ncbi:MAG: hypothetical protein ABFD50_04570 [Smithella sp.]
MGTGGNNPKRIFDQQVNQFVEDLESAVNVRNFELGGDDINKGDIFKPISKNTFRVLIDEGVYAIVSFTMEDKK